MRKNIVAGNWKMNKTLAEGIQLAEEIKKLIASKENNNAGIIINTPFVHLTEIAKVVKDTRIEAGAQNCASEAKGAFTGEVSAEMLKSTGIKYVIIGHSERRSYYHETDEMLYKKVLLALQNGLTPIFCCGEVLAQRNAGIHFEVVKNQLNETIFKLPVDEFNKIIIAYEPVWAIGTGVTATPQQAQEMHAYIRKQIEAKYSSIVAQNISILYGGSCNAQNARELFANPDVDGGLIGGASLKAEDFVSIVYSF